jgi:segregation and condensation protein B
MIDSSEDNNIDWQLIAKLEALLFVAPGLSSVAQLGSALEISNSRVLRLLEVLNTHYKKFHGIRLQRINARFQLTTAPEYGTLIETFLGLEVTTRLSQAALEALAIVAYKQPATKPEIDSIRGVNSDGVIKNLLSKGLIEELGRTDAVGRPILYGVTADFLQHFGLETLKQLPSINLEELSNNHKENGEDKRILKD